MKNPDLDLISIVAAQMPDSAQTIKCAKRFRASHRGPRLENGNGKRRHKRIKMVLPVRISGRDASNNPVNELAHTLDITPNGARLGAIRHVLRTGDKLTLQYHQRKIQFRVVWVTQLEGTTEYQVGLESTGTSGETWGLELADCDTADEYSKPVNA